MPFRVGPWEIGLILMIILVIFGVGKLPQVGGAIGKGLREFGKGQRGEYDEEGGKAPKLKRVTNQKVVKSQTKK